MFKAHERARKIEVAIQQLMKTDDREVWYTRSVLFKSRVEARGRMRSVSEAVYRRMHVKGEDYVLGVMYKD